MATARGPGAEPALLLRLRHQSSAMVQNEGIDPSLLTAALMLPLSLQCSSPGSRPCVSVRHTTHGTPAADGAVAPTLTVWGGVETHS